MKLIKGRKYILKENNRINIVTGISEDSFIYYDDYMYTFTVYKTDIFIVHSSITMLFYSIDKKKLDKQHLLK